MSKKQLTCRGCGCIVHRYPSQIMRPDAVFCSRDCRNKNYKRAFPSWKHPAVKEYKHRCAGCQREFTTRGSDYRAKCRTYCSKRCSAKHAKRKPHSQETKAKLSAAAARQSVSYARRYLYRGPNGEIRMRSSWELRFACWLDKQGIAWTYEPQFKLSSGHVYMPDFQLASSDIIEIKGYMREDAKAKWDIFCAEYPEINKILLMKEDLKKLGVI